MKVPGGETSHPPNSFSGGGSRRLEKTSEVFRDGLSRGLVPASASGRVEAGPLGRAASGGKLWFRDCMRQGGFLTGDFCLPLSPCSLSSGNPESFLKGNADRIGTGMSSKQRKKPQATPLVTQRPATCESGTETQLAFWA